MTLATVPRYDRSTVPTVGERAVVVGGSVAGLCTARVLADAFSEVLVLERDPFPDEPAVRDGAPQTSHPHALLEAGRATLEDFFPGFGEDLLRDGGLMVDAASEMVYYDRGGFAADPPGRLAMYCASRALFEHVIRRRIRALDGVQLRGDCQFVDFLTEGEPPAVAGVRFRGEDGTERTSEADLVVDASGRTSRTPRWLDDHGYDAPPVDEVHVDLTYSSIRIERPPDDRRTFFNLPTPPRTRGAAFIPIENGQWEVILSGIHGDDAPRERERFVAFADTLPVDEIGDLVRSQQWLSDEIHQYPFPSSLRRRYERLDRFPEGLVVTGDAIASFNPVYGQGMSVAALDALLLHHALADGGLDGLADRFFDEAAEVVDIVWKIAVGADFEFPQTTGPKPPGTDLFNRYIGRLIRRSHGDGELTEAFYRVFRLEQPPTSLLRPSIVWRVLRPSVGSSQLSGTARRAPDG
jgi:2-polyprenyl-6-methoxyphenol hydroxylase-like FAD-dependent oxidoreductase